MSSQIIRQPPNCSVSSARLEAAPSWAADDSAGQATHVPDDGGIFDGAQLSKIAGQIFVAAGSAAIPLGVQSGPAPALPTWQFLRWRNPLSIAMPDAPDAQDTRVDTVYIDIDSANPNDSGDIQVFKKFIAGGAVTLNAEKAFRQFRAKLAITQGQPITLSGGHLGDSDDAAAFVPTAPKTQCPVAYILWYGSTSVVMDARTFLGRYPTGKPYVLRAGAFERDDAIGVVVDVEPNHWEISRGSDPGTNASPITLRWTLRHGSTSVGVLRYVDSQGACRVLRPGSRVYSWYGTPPLYHNDVVFPVATSVVALGPDFDAGGNVKHDEHTFAIAGAVALEGYTKVGEIDANGTIPLVTRWSWRGYNYGKAGIMPATESVLRVYPRASIDGAIDASASTPATVTIYATDAGGNALSNDEIGPGIYYRLEIRNDGATGGTSDPKIVNAPATGGASVFGALLSSMLIVRQNTNPMTIEVAASSTSSFTYDTMLFIEPVLPPQDYSGNINYIANDDLSLHKPRYAPGGTAAVWVHTVP